MEPPQHEFAGIDFECPQCGTPLDEYHEHCPDCGYALDEEFCATYRPPIPPAIKLIAFLLLVGVVLVPLALLLWHFLF